MRKKKSKLKIVICSLIIAVCLFLDGFYLYILKQAPDKAISQTFYINEQTIKYEDPTTGELVEDKEPFCEIALWDNCFEIKFNELMDETQTNFYSKGIQFFVEDGQSLETNITNNYTKNGDNAKLQYSIFKDNIEDDTTRVKNFQENLGIFGAIENKYIYKKRLMYHKTYEGLTVTEYASTDNFKTTTGTVQKLYEPDNYFKIQIDDEIYAISPLFDEKLEKTKLEEEKKIGKFKVGEVTTNRHYSHGFLNAGSGTEYTTYEEYRVCDMYYIAEMYFDSIKETGFTSSSNAITFQFENYFNFYKYLGNFQYEKINREDSEDGKVIVIMKQYLQAKVHRYEGKMTSSDQSLFSAVRSSPNYEQKTENNKDQYNNDYWIGRTIIDVGKKDFIPVKDRNRYLLKLLEDFKLANQDFADVIILRITIDLDYLNSMGVTFNGFVEGTFGDFKVYEIYTTKVENGETIITNVTENYT